MDAIEAIDRQLERLVNQRKQYSGEYQNAERYQIDALIEPLQAKLIEMLEPKAIEFPTSPVPYRYPSDVGPFKVTCTPGKPWYANPSRSVNLNGEEHF